jgi:hypothetical protein
MNKWATNKYFTYKLSGIYKNLFRINTPDIIEKAEQLDPISTVFGFSYVNLDDEVTIFEGPLDSFLFHNSVGLCSVNNQFPFDISNKNWLKVKKFFFGRSLLMIIVYLIETNGIGMM